jgi:hypothetical protein
VQGGAEHVFEPRHDSDQLFYLMTVHSREWITVSNFPPNYVERNGWKGEKGQVPGHEEVSMTATIRLSEGKNGCGWTGPVLRTVTAQHPVCSSVGKGKSL